LLPILLELIIYLITNKLFRKNTSMNLRGRDDIIDISTSLTQTLAQKFLQHVPLNVSLIKFFRTLLLKNFHFKIQKLFNCPEPDSNW
jgi:hypothetical protein